MHTVATPAADLSLKSEFIEHRHYAFLIDDGLFFIDGSVMHGLGGECIDHPRNPF
jgi:hypothetical protein